MMNNLNIETAENGFVAYENDSSRVGMVGKKWAFETSDSLSSFIYKWSEQNMKKMEVAEQSGKE